MSFEPVELPRTLVFSPRANDTSQVLAPAAHRRGLLTEHMTGWHVPEGFLVGGPAHLYAGPLFADAIAADLGIALLEPPDDWLVRLPREAVRREIRMLTMAEAWTLRTPAFLKPPNDKSFPARVYLRGDRSCPAPTPSIPTPRSSPATRCGSRRVPALRPRRRGRHRCAVRDRRGSRHRAAGRPRGGEPDPRVRAGSAAGVGRHASERGRRRRRSDRWARRGRRGKGRPGAGRHRGQRGLGLGSLCRRPRARAGRRPARRRAVGRDDRP